MSRIWLDDVAEAISNAHCPNDYLSAIGFKNNLLRQLRDAALNGELACYNSVGKYKPRAYETLISTTKEAVNLWLKSIDSPYRYGQTEAVGDAETGNHAGTEPKPEKKHQKRIKILNEWYGALCLNHQNDIDAINQEINGLTNEEIKTGLANITQANEKYLWANGADRWIMDNGESVWKFKRTQGGRPKKS